MKAYYLIAAVAGTVLPWYFIATFLAGADGGLTAFATEVMAARASMGFVIDLFISSFAFWPFLFAEAKLKRTPSPWIFLALNLTVGLSCALPLFLFFREGRSEGY